jgi:hypothetical protein
MAEFGASPGGWSRSCSSDAQTMLPEPRDPPTPEPDDELEDDPENERKDEPDDDLEDDPQDESDTLYFGREDGCTARCCRSPTSRPGREAAMGEGAASVSFRGGSTSQPRRSDGG